MQTNNISEKIIERIRLGDTNYIFNGLCNHNNNELYLDYIFFKHFASEVTYAIILQVITNKINSILDSYRSFIVHVNLQTLSLFDIEKHKNFVSLIANYLKTHYPNKLEKCYIHNSPSIWTQLYNFVSLFIDKETQKKIHLL